MQDRVLRQKDLPNQVYSLSLLICLLCPSYFTFIIVQGTSTSARSSGDMSAGTCGRINAMAEDAGGGEARRKQEQERAGGKDL